MSLVGLCCALSCIFVVSCESPSGGDGGGSGGKTLDRIVITSLPTKTTYIKGEELNLAGLVVTAYYTDNTSASLTVAAANVTGYNKDTIGQQTLTITVSGKTATFTVTVTASGINANKTLDRIAVTTPPAKINYAKGEELNLAGMVVTAHYTDNTSEPVAVAAANVTGYNKNTLGTQTLTVTLGGKTATFTVTVTAAGTNSGANTITLYWVDEQGSLAFTNGAAVSVSGAGTLTIAAQGTGYTGQIWFINGSETAANAGQSSYTFSGAGKEAGKQYVIGLRAAKDGKYYYAELVVTVTAPTAAQ